MRMIACYENFPELSIHEKTTFTFTLSNKKLQQRLMQVFLALNQKTFTFEEIGTPTIPGCTIIFEVGIADSNSFTSIGENEVKRVLTALRKEPFAMMDFFCAIRYYKDYATRKKPLRFDYYITRFVFSENMVELQVFHERGPRYFSPKDIVTFLTDRINDNSAKKILKKIEPQETIV